jgi:hypothetical protein
LSPANANPQSHAYSRDTNPLRTAALNAYAYADDTATNGDPFTPGHSNSNAITYALHHGHYVYQPSAHHDPGIR